MKADTHIFHTGEKYLSYNVGGGRVVNAYPDGNHGYVLWVIPAIDPNDCFYRFGSGMTYNRREFKCRPNDVLVDEDGRVKDPARTRVSEWVKANIERRRR